MNDLDALAALLGSLPPERVGLYKIFIHWYCELLAEPRARFAFEDESRTALDRLAMQARKQGHSDNAKHLFGLDLSTKTGAHEALDLASKIAGSEHAKSELVALLAWYTVEEHRAADIDTHNRGSIRGARP